MTGADIKESTGHDNGVDRRGNGGLNPALADGKFTQQTLEGQSSVRHMRATLKNLAAVLTTLQVAPTSMGAAQDPSPPPQAAPQLSSEMAVQEALKSFETGFNEWINSTRMSGDDVSAVQGALQSALAPLSGASEEKKLEELVDRMTALNKAWGKVKKLEGLQDVDKELKKVNDLILEALLPPDAPSRLAPDKDVEGVLGSDATKLVQEGYGTFQSWSRGQPDTKEIVKVKEAFAKLQEPVAAEMKDSIPARNEVVLRLAELAKAFEALQSQYRDQELLTEAGNTLARAVKEASKVIKDSPVNISEIDKTIEKFEDVQLDKFLPSGATEDLKKILRDFRRLAEDAKPTKGQVDPVLGEFNELGKIAKDNQPRQEQRLKAQLGTLETSLRAFNGSFPDTAKPSGVNQWIDTVADYRAERVNDEFFKATDKLSVPLDSPFRRLSILYNDKFVAWALKDGQDVKKKTVNPLEKAFEDFDSAGPAAMIRSVAKISEEVMKLEEEQTKIAKDRLSRQNLRLLVELREGIAKMIPNHPATFRLDRSYKDNSVAKEKITEVYTTFQQEFARSGGPFKQGFLSEFKKFCEDSYNPQKFSSVLRISERYLEFMGNMSSADFESSADKINKLLDDLKQMRDTYVPSPNNQP